MKMSLILASLVLSSVSYASSVRDLTNIEMDTLNWLLDCPKELTKITQQGKWIGSGRFFSNPEVSGFSYRFFRYRGLGVTEYVATLNVSRFIIKNPPADGSNIHVECKIQNETL